MQLGESRADVWNHPKRRLEAIEETRVVVPGESLKTERKWSFRHSYKDQRAAVESRLGNAEWFAFFRGVACPMKQQLQLQAYLV